MEPTRDAVWKAKEKHAKVEQKDALLRNAAGGLSSPSAREIMEKYEIYTQIDRLEKARLLYLAVSRFAETDLSPERVDNDQMSYIFEELMRIASSR